MMTRPDTDTGPAMCGRFTLTASPHEVADFFDIREVPDVVPRFNIAPSQSVIVARSTKRDEPAGRELAHVQWGLIPSWADDPKIGYKMINARGEGVDTKPAFRRAFRRRRCLIPANGFYEWRQIAGRKRKQPYYIRPADGGLWAFGGVWERWRSPDDEIIDSCSIITTKPNELVEELHDRMPLILSPADWALWLDRDCEDVDRLLPLVRTWPAEGIEMFPVSMKVNRAADDNDDASMIEPIEIFLDDDGDGSDDRPRPGRQKELF